MVMTRGEPAGCKVKNRFSLFESDQEDDEGPPGLTDSEDEEESKASRSRIPVRVKRWSQNASQRKSDKGRDSIKLLQAVRSGSINGCSENVKEWEELEFLVDSGASATVIGKEDAGAVQASEPDPSLHYTLADGSVIPHMGDKMIRAVTDELTPLGGYKPLNFGCSVTDVDKPLLSVAQLVRHGGKVVFAKDESYIDLGDGRRDQLEFRDGLFRLKLWVPRDQKMDFHGQA